MSTGGFEIVRWMNNVDGELPMNYDEDGDKKKGRRANLKKSHPFIKSQFELPQGGEGLGSFLQTKIVAFLWSMNPSIFRNS